MGFDYAVRILRLTFTFFALQQLGRDFTMFQENLWKKELFIYGVSLIAGSSCTHQTMYKAFQ